MLVSVLTTEMIKISADFHEFYDLISYLSDTDQQCVTEAFIYARLQHDGQKRKSGEPYILHPVTVAASLAYYHVGAAVIIAALLHDVAEDTSASVREIGERFGKDVAHIVDGVTKFESAEQKLDPQLRNQATLAKLFRFTTHDIRVGLIKIFDRLHNMQTISEMSPAHQEKKARETLKVYAPLANRLGMWHIKNELESMAFHILHNDQATQIDHEIAEREKKHRPILEEVRHILIPQLEKLGIYKVKLQLSPRHSYSIFRKAVENHHVPIVDNFPRIVVTVRHRHNCYTALGVIHSLWQYNESEIRDYICRPRDNLYRALQTTVLYSGKHGIQQIKFRIRTQDMVLASDLGVLGRWGAKLGDPEIESAIKEQIDNFIKLIQNSNREMDDGETANGVLSDVLPQQIIAYTPKGEGKTLPRGSTPIDFAYAIHTELGHSCCRASVNEKPTHLNTPLKDGDRVAITRRNHSPERIWLEEDLGYLQTNYARSCVRRWFHHLSAEVAIAQGKQLLSSNLTMIGQPHYPHLEVAKWYGYENVEHLYLDLGLTERSVNSVMQKVLAASWLEARVRRIGRTVTSAAGEKFIILNADNFQNFTLCHHCHPRPGNSIVGYVNKSNRVKIHNEQCNRLPPETQAKKILRLRWGEGESDEVHLIHIDMCVYDRQDFLHEVTSLIHKEEINIASICTNPTPNQKFIEVHLCIELNNPRQLMRMLYQFQSLYNVNSVRVSHPKSHDELTAK